MAKVYRNPVTGLTEAQLERLTHLEEECSEVIKAICKIKRHGYDAKDPTKPDSPTNKVELENELRDVIFAAERLNRRGEINFIIEEAVDFSPILWEKKERYFHFQDDGF